MKNHFNYIESITKKIEDAIQQALQNHEEVVNSIILGWSYDRTKIHIWFEFKLQTNCVLVALLYGFGRKE